MKQSDIITVIAVAFLGILVSYFSLNALLSDPNEAEVSFQTVNAIDSDLPEPSADIFNSAAINPTVEVYVGGCVDSNQNGILDDEEKIICGNNVIELDDEETQEEENTEEETESSSASSSTNSSSTSSSSSSSSSNSASNSSSSTNNSSVESEGE